MSAQVNFRTAEALLADIDKLVAEGHFRTRTEAVNEALRMLVQRYRGGYVPPAPTMGANLRK